jgi:hypothetical protein
MKKTSNVLRAITARTRIPKNIGYAGALMALCFLFLYSSPAHAQCASAYCTDAEARSALAANGITVNKANCPTLASTNCTSLNEIPRVAISNLIALKNDAPSCTIVVTGGTEAGHKSHGPKKGMIDIRNSVQSGYPACNSIPDDRCATNDPGISKSPSCYQYTTPFTCLIPLLKNPSKYNLRQVIPNNNPIVSSAAYRNGTFWEPNCIPHFHLTFNVDQATNVSPANTPTPKPTPPPVYPAPFVSTPYNFQLSYPAINGVVPSTTNFADFISYLYLFGIMGSALLTLMMIVYSGTRYIITPIVGSKQRYLDLAKKSLFGFVLILGAAALFNTINPGLLRIIQPYIEPAPSEEEAVVPEIPSEEPPVVPEPTPAATPPTADIKINGSDSPITVPYNVPITIVWNSSNADDCTVEPPIWTGTSGTQVVMVTADTTYDLICTGPAGAAYDTIAVAVETPGKNLILFPSAFKTEKKLSANWTNYPTNIATRSSSTPTSFRNDCGVIPPELSVSKTYCYDCGGYICEASLYRYELFRDGTRIATDSIGIIIDNAPILDGATHSYQMRAVNSAGTAVETSDEAEYQWIADTTAPPRPTALTVTPLNSYEMKLGWTQSGEASGTSEISAEFGFSSTPIPTEDLDHYNVYRNGTLIASRSNWLLPEYTDRTAVPGTTYQYYVTAVDRDGNESVRSNTVTITAGIADTQPPTAPTGLTATSLSTSRVELKWNSDATDNVGVVGYYITRTSTNNGAFNGTTLLATPGSPVLSTTYQDNYKILPGSTQSYSVRAVDGAGNQSPPISATIVMPGPDSVPPSPPPTLIAAQDDPDKPYSVNLVWSQTTDNIKDQRLLSYPLFRNTVLLFTGSTDFLSTTHSFGLSGLGGGMHTYYVKCQDTASGIINAASLPVTFGIGVSSAPPIRFSPFSFNDIPEDMTAKGATTAITIKINTELPATCGYSETAGTPFTSMTPMNANPIEGTDHTISIDNVLKYAYHTYYVRCRDNASGMVNTDDYPLYIGVAATSAHAPFIMNAFPHSFFAGGKDKAALKVETPDSAECRYGMAPLDAYASMTPMDHLLYPETIPDNYGTYNYYVKASDGRNESGPSNTETINFPPGTQLAPPMTGWPQPGTTTGFDKIAGTNIWCSSANNICAFLAFGFSFFGLDTQPLIAAMTGKEGKIVVYSPNDGTGMCADCAISGPSGTGPSLHFYFEDVGIETKRTFLSFFKNSSCTAAMNSIITTGGTNIVSSGTRPESGGGCFPVSPEVSAVSIGGGMCGVVVNYPPAYCKLPGQTTGLWNPTNCNTSHNLLDGPIHWTSEISCIPPQLFR